MEKDYTQIPTKLERVKTGVSKLDDLLSGGLPKNTITLISGPPGSGKTILCHQFLHKGIEEGDNCLFLTLDKKIEGTLNQAREVGLDFQSAIEKGQIKFLFLNINNKLVYESMTNEILSGEYDRIVLDSITPLSEMPVYIKNVKDQNNVDIVATGNFSSKEDLPVKRLNFHYILNTLGAVESTSVVTSELPAGSSLLSRDGISEFLADGVIALSFDPTMNRRKLSVMKMRSTEHTLKPQDMQIGKGGIRII